tara:strand:- start:53 stop:283 length:231 start_codon:yes stop_codon:yes gene_type:complete
VPREPERNLRLNNQVQILLLQLQTHVKPLLALVQVLHKQVSVVYRQHEKQALPQMQPLKLHEIKRLADNKPLAQPV